MKHILALCTFAFCSCFLQAQKVVNLRTEHLINPMSITTRTPRLGWQIASENNACVQKEYHIIVSSTREKAEKCEGDLWDTTVKSDESQWISYAGKGLRSNMRCYWRVRLLTTKGRTQWSDIAMWNVGLLKEADWKGQWIGLEHAMPWDVEDVHSRLSARYLRKEFTLDKEVRQAVMYICGLGLYEAYINGQKVGDQVLAPAPTDYRKTVLYNAFDVTEMLGKKNAIGVVLGNGRFYTMQQKKKPYKIANFGYPKMRLNLIVEFTDGSRKLIVSDDKWKLSADGAIRSNNEYDGEIFDARKQFNGWTKTGYDDSSWANAERAGLPTGTLRGMMMPYMKVLSILPSKLLPNLSEGGDKKVSTRGDLEWAKGKSIFDFSQNTAGWVKLRIPKMNAGDTLIIRYAEKLDKDGTLYTANLRNAQTTDYYISNGKDEGTMWSPIFSYHGFRYVEINRTDIPASDVVAEVVSDEMEETGAFHCGNEVLNSVYKATVWGIRSNYKGMPVDCPQRDERQPWLGDRTGGCFGEAYVFDNLNLYRKWNRDIAEAQREDGCIPDVAPAFWNYYSDNMTWPAALPFSMMMQYRQYGDAEAIRSHYADVKRWLAYMKEEYGEDGLITKDKYGDWCTVPESLELIHSQDPARRTDGVLISTAYYYKLCNVMAEFAHIIGLDADVAFFTAEAEKTKQAFNRTFLHIRKGTSTLPGHILHPDSTYYDNNTVTANILPLAFGMIDDADVRAEVEKNVIKTILTDNKGKLSCGVIGIQWLMQELRRMGRGDIAWLLATSNKYPSWGYMTAQGATTIWELWNGDTANPRMNSGNHVMLLGDLVTWIYEDVAGIRALRQGFKEIELKPDFSVDEMDDVESSYNSIYGRIVSRWKKENGRLLWHIEIPANTSAKAYMPDGEVKSLASGKYDLECSLIVKPVVADEFLYKSAGFPECHSASIIELKNGDLLATYFGGTKERNPDVCIWVSRKAMGAIAWDAPQMVADGVMSDTLRYACWNPVLYQTADGEVMLYFKIGPNVAGWTGWYCSSSDDGRTWSARQPLQDGFLGPVKNKPIENKGRLIAPTSVEKGGWRLYFELSDDDGKTWRRTDYVTAPTDSATGKPVQAIQPTIIILPDGRLEALCRTRSRYIGRTFSTDNGETWSQLELIDVPNNNSGLDAVNLKKGGYALICNDRPIERTKQKGDRTPLSVLRSDDGITWHHWVTLEDSPIGQYSYPSIIQGADGHLHAVYTWRRQRIKHVELVP
ncbi:MAG: family 78 glycoside hydrolase catalytic domain [Prevotella sp.]|nr:family 78 glycoside hydrolase catalytic domain [Candidatus Equicola faecalis]